MAETPDITALREELTIQEVILESLLDQTFDGVDEERSRTKREIELLKDRLRQLRQPRANDDGGDDEQQSVPSDASPARSRPTTSPSAILPLQPRLTNTHQGRPPVDVPNASNSSQDSAFNTPRRGAMGNDIWSSPAGGSLPNRKRTFDASTLHGDGNEVKTRRITSNASSDLPVIDLTCFDDEIAQCLAEQTRQVERFEQEGRDRDFALQLAGLPGTTHAGPTSQSPASHEPQELASWRKGPRAGSGSSDRFSYSGQQRQGHGSASSSPAVHKPRELASWRQGPRAGSGSSGRSSYSGQRQGQHTSSAQSLADPTALSPHDLSLLVPGAYNNAWDHSQHPSSSHYNQKFSFQFPAVTSVPSQSPSTSHYSAPRTPQIPAKWSPFLNRAPDTVTRASPLSQISFAPPSAASFQAPQVAGPTNARSLPGSSVSSLSHAIDITSSYDFLNGVDALGNPLNERLTSFYQDAFHDPRVSEKELDDLLQNIRQDMDIPERHRDGTLEGLLSALYPHQELAVAWMKKMEEGSSKGGILADDMGLGKTISTLALMLTRPPQSRNKTTLIIAPVALLHQWREELVRRLKASHMMTIFTYHNKKATTEDLLRYDVVLTTYGTIAKESGRLEKFLEDGGSRNLNLIDQNHAYKFPLLHPSKAEFFRVILDEAQCIKNKETKTAKACYRLRATHRWCLTGTPMMNGVLELFSLVRFLRIKPHCNWDQFRQAFGILFGKDGDSKGVAMNRLRALLKAIMLRRKKDSKLDGQPILKLPPKTEEIIHVELSSEELNLYNQLERKSRIQFNKYLRAGSIGKNFTNILVLLLRMRQACCHPHLNLDVDDAVVLTVHEQVATVKSLSPAVVERIKALDAFDCPICFDAAQSLAFFYPCGHDCCCDCLTRLADGAATRNLRAGDESGKARCPVCRASFDPRKCFSYDDFRSVHMPETVERVLDAEADVYPSSDADDGDDDDDDGNDDDDDNDEDDDDGGNDDISSTNGGKAFGSAKSRDSNDEVDGRGKSNGFPAADDVDKDDDDNGEDGGLDGEKSSATTRKKGTRINKPNSKKKKKRDRKGKAKACEIKPSMLKKLRHDASRNQDLHKQYMRYLRKTWLPSAKVTECMKLLRTIEERGEKTIVFSQWTSLLDLLQVAMLDEKFRHKPERYDGGMSSDQRIRAATAFRDRRETSVLLVSLKAGNAGLNLTAASNVIIMDPFWNPYIEMQAIDRAHRIGQKREVKVYRILATNTIEDRIIALQDRKKEIVEAALDETESRKIGRLGVGELKFLFNAPDD